MADFLNMDIVLLFILAKNRIHSWNVICPICYQKCFESIMAVLSFFLSICIVNTRKRNLNHYIIQPNQS